MTGKGLCCLALTVLLGLTATAQTKKSEAPVLCPSAFQPADLSPYGFARAMLESLWYASAAVKDVAAEIQDAQKSDDPFALLTASMRGTKLSTKDFVCAKKAIERFASPKTQLLATADQRDKLRSAATYSLKVYDAHLDLNRRLLDLTKKSGNISPVEFSDQISTLEVERGQRWDDLIPAIAMTAMMLIDPRATDENGHFITPTKENPGYTKRLIITTKQKQAFLDWIDEHFPELKDGTPNDQIPPSSKDTALFLKVLDGRMCSDE